MSYPMHALSQQQVHLATSPVARSMRRTVCRCKSWLHLPGEKRIGRKRNGNDPFLFSCKTIQLEKIDECPPDIHAHHRGRKKLALECRLLRCPTVRKFQEHGIKLG